MRIKIATEKSSLNLEVLGTYLEIAVKHMDMGEGTLSYPIVLDKFVINSTDAIPEITIGINEYVIMTLECNKAEEKKFKPKLHYCKGSDLTKSSDQLIVWSDIFKLNEKGSEPDTKITVSPDGFLYVKSDDINKHCTIGLKSEAPTFERYIGYGAVLSLRMEINQAGLKKRLYFILDPLMKVSSNQG